MRGMFGSTISGAASVDLGLGGGLSDRVDEETDDEKLRRKGLATQGQLSAMGDLFGYGKTGIAPTASSGMGSLSARPSR